MDNLLTHTQALLNQVYWFKQELNLTPEKEHLGCAIEWTDITERKHDFLNELVNTIASWVYSKSRSKEIVDNRLQQVNEDYANAYTFLTTQAFSKFRPGLPQGQFGELLLFNFIQFFFKAVPLLRKQRITTSTGHERFGADAVHFKKTKTSNVIILGESKCYKSDYRFKQAFEESLSSIDSTVKNFNSELDLYIYDDFIEKELEKIALDFKANRLENVKFELVCLIAYNETKSITGENEQQTKESIRKIIEERCSNINDESYGKVDGRILERINYIVFPIWQFDELLNEFMNKIGAS